MAPKNFLNNLTVSSPCTADWNFMIGNDQVRYCEHCDLKVHNLSRCHAIRSSASWLDRMGAFACVQLLLSAGAAVNAKNSAGETVLMMLDDDATSDLVWDLLNAGAEVNLRDKSGATALMHFASSHNLEALRTLLDAGAEVNAKDKQGRTPLMLAASEGLVNNVRALVLAGADINTIDEDEMDALTHATENDHTAVVRFLKSKGAMETVARVEKEQ